MKESMELERTDLATFMSGLAGKLRKDSLALRGHAGREHDPGDVQHKELTSLADSLEWTAALLDITKRQLCQKCRMGDVVEGVVFGVKAKAEKKRD